MNYTMIKKISWFPITIFLTLPLIAENVEQPMVVGLTKKPAPQTLSIEQVVNQALIKKPSIHAYNYSIKNYEQQRKGTLSTFLPNISVSQTLYNSNNTSLYTSNLKRAESVQASQTVLNLGKINHYKMFNAQVSAAQHAKESHIDEVQLATETIFLTSWLLQQKLKQVLLLFEASKKTFDQAKNQYELQLLDKNEWLKANATHASNLAVVSAYQDDIAEAEKNLEYYIQDPISLLIPRSDFYRNANQKDYVIKKFFPTSLTWNPHKPITLESFYEYFKKAIANRKDLKSKQDTITLKAETSKYYTKQYVPTVSIFGNASRNHYWSGSAVTSKDGGIRLSWNAFDGLTNYFNKSAANAEKMQAILEKSDLISQIKLEVQQAYSALQKELDILVSEQISFKQACNEFVLNKQQYKTGLISEVDFQTAQYNYENARITWLNQAVTTAIKERELQKACGYPA